MRLVSVLINAHNRGCVKTVPRTPQDWCLLDGPEAGALRSDQVGDSADDLADDSA